MADKQVIEIKLILKDEISKGIQDAFAKMRAEDAKFAASAQRGHQALQGMHGGLQMVGRELRTLASIAGVTGGLFGGGLIAGIAAVGKSLGDMAREGLQLHYTAQALGVTTETLTKYSDALVALGQSHEQARSGITSAMGALRDLQTQGTKSNIFQELAKDASGNGARLARELMAELNGPNGMQGALQLLFNRMQGMNPEAQRAIAKMFGLGTVGARDITTILPLLNERLQLSVADAQRLALANANLEISMGNIGTQLANALMPPFSRFVSALDTWLQSEAGQKFVDQIAAWGEDLATATAAWIEEGGLQNALEGLNTVFADLKIGFLAVDKIVNDMGIGWPRAIAGIVALKLGAELASIAIGLAAVARIPGILRVLPLIAGYYAAKKFREAVGGEEREKGAIERVPGGGRLEDMPGLTEEQRKNLEGFRGGRYFLPRRNMPQPQPQSGEAPPKTEPERRADLDADRRESRQLTEEFKATHYSFAKLNDYLTPGGPEGRADGGSGFQLPKPGPKGDVSGLPAGIIAPPGSGHFAGRTLTPLPPPIAKGSVLSGVASGIGMGSWYANFAGLSKWVDPADTPYSNALRVGEARQGKSLGSRETLGGWPRVTTPTGEQYKAQQTEVGPGTRTKKLLDISAAGAEAMGYTPKTFPTGGIFGVEPTTLDLMNSARIQARERDLMGQLPLERPWHRSGGLDTAIGAEAGISSITKMLANEGGGINGSATVDIDVGGMSKPPRQGGALFRPVPTSGAVQMENTSRPPSNPLSFQ